MSSFLNKMKGTKDNSSSSSSSSDEERIGGRDEQLRKEEAPVVKERIHEQYEHADQTRSEEIHKKTNIDTTVQPLIDQRREHGDTKIVDEGTRVREVGTPQLDDAAQAEMQRRHDEVAASGGRTRTEAHAQVDERPDARRSDRLRQVEQVQPVIERDIEQPHRVEHKKKDVTIVHEPAKFNSAQVAPAVTVDEYQNK